MLTEEESYDQYPEGMQLYRIILFNDDEHTYDYVISMLTDLFGMSIHEAHKIAYEIDYIGEATVKICPMEEATNGRDRILSYGPDPNLDDSRSSMQATIQPVEEREEPDAL